MLQNNLSTKVSPAAKFHRRGVLETLALAGLGTVVGTGAAAADSPRGKGPRVSTPTVGSPAAAKKSTSFFAGKVADLPEEWRVHQGATIPEYLKFLNSLKLKKVSPDQVIQAHAKSKNGVWNTLPPKSWWLRMGYTLRVVDRIAVAMNTSEVEVVSAYRHPMYNARCPGARAGSWHQANVAADVKFANSPREVAHAARYLRDKGLFRGGIGGYGGFTHIDTRGQNVNWGA
ncbi:MAG: D-Ala-D-Ala carboxypeptidase family metallohydrolase [Verrucomicrobiota bacterium]